MAVEISKCVIISGAPENDYSYYNKYLDDSFIICADSGYVKCSQLGITPNVIIGDFDSSDYPDINTKIIKLNERKDDTDTFHCVKYAIEHGYNDITILGGIGSRIDHTYANIMSLVYCFNNSIDARLVNSNNLIKIISGDNTIKSDGYKYFSLYALFEKCSGLSIINASYELDRVELLPFEQFTQSNAFISDTATVNVENGNLILILSND